MQCWQEGVGGTEIKSEEMGMKEVLDKEADFYKLAP